MTFIDASIIVAIINEEPDWQHQGKRLTVATGLRYSPLVRFEAMLGVAKGAARASSRRTNAQTLADARAAVDRLLSDLGAEQVSITPEIGFGATNASITYGKAVGHDADLNFGDCFAYACAKSLGAALLYKGDDFAKTDLA